MASDFPSEYEKALDRRRYSAGTVQPHEMLSLLGERDRWPSERPSNNRAIVADYLDDSERYDEAKLLRDPRQHVVVHEGKVKRGKWPVEKLNDAMREFRDAALRYNNTFHDYPVPLVRVQPHRDHPGKHELYFEYATPPNAGSNFIDDEIKPEGHELRDLMHREAGHLVENAINADTVTPEGLPELHHLVRQIKELPVEEVGE
jgi:hypothetical protein